MNTIGKLMSLIERRENGLKSCIATINSQMALYCHLVIIKGDNKLSTVMENILTLNSGANLG